MGQLVGDLWKVCGVSGCISHRGFEPISYAKFSRMQFDILYKTELRTVDSMVNSENRRLKNIFPLWRLHQKPGFMGGF
jgi:hypothetical protein